MTSLDTLVGNSERIGKGKGLIGFLSIGAFLTRLLLPAPALADDPQAPESTAYEEDSCVTPRSCFDMANELIEQGDYIKAIKFLEKSRGLTPDEDIQDKLSRAILLYNIGSLYARGGDPDKAIVHLQQYHDLPNFDALEQQAAERKKSFVGRESIREHIAALEFYARGRELHDKGQFADAITSYQHALNARALHGQQDIRSQIYRDIALSHEQSGEASQAVVYYKEYLRTTRRGAPDWNSIFERVTRLEEALRNPPSSDAPVLSLPVSEPAPAVVPSPAPSNESLVSPPPASRHTQEQPSRFQHLPLILATGGAAGALGITGAVFNYRVGQKFDRSLNGCGQTDEGCSEEAIAELRNDVHGDELARDISYGAALVAAATSLGLLTWDIVGLLREPSPGSRRRSSTSPSPKSYYQVTPSSIGVGVQY